MELLKPQQQPHCDRLLDILEDSLFACDLSVMGSGKTWVACAASAETGLPMIIFCPRGSITDWETTANAVGAKYLHIGTYASFRSIKGCQPKHGLLHRFCLLYTS